MKEIRLYEAKDGKIFDSLEDCEKYENDLLIESFDRIYFFDGEFHQNLFDKNSYDPLMEITDNSSFIVVKDFGQWVNFIEALNSEGYYNELERIVVKEGIYYYNEDFEVWQSFENQKMFFDEVKERLQKFLC